MRSESLTLLFEKARGGDSLAANLFYQLTFHRLRKIAASLLKRERAGHTLQASALVNELFLRLRRLETRISSADHFFCISSRAMRQVLVDHARIHDAQKRVPPESIPEFLSGTGRSRLEPESLLAVRQVFERLRSIDPVAAATVWDYGVEGFTVEEVSQRQARKPWRVRADYEFALKWMCDRLTIAPSGSPADAGSEAT